MEKIKFLVRGSAKEPYEIEFIKTTVICLLRVHVQQEKMGYIASTDLTS